MSCRMRTSFRACRRSTRPLATNAPPDAASSRRCAKGRVIKLEGNPADPISQGAICARGQAGLQGLYNPDRLRAPMLRGADGKLTKISWDDALKQFANHLKDAAGKGNDRIAMIASPQGPTLQKITAAFLGAYKSNRATYYEAISDEPAREAAADGVRTARSAVVSHRSGRGADLVRRGFPRDLALADRTRAPVCGISRTEKSQRRAHDRTRDLRRPSLQHDRGEVRRMDRLARRAPRRCSRWPFFM